MSFILQGILVFLCAAAVDIAYVKWMLNVSEGRRARAAVASMSIGAAGLVGVTGVVHDHWLALPYLFGLGIGTVLGMERS